MKSNAAKSNVDSGEQAAKGAAPAFEAFTVREGSAGKRAHWTKIGAMWPDKDGNGYSLDLDALPIGRRIQLRVPRERGAAGSDNDGAEGG